MATGVTLLEMRDVVAAITADHVSKVDVQVGPTEDGTIVESVVIYFESHDGYSLEYVLAGDDVHDGHARDRMVETVRRLIDERRPPA